MVKYYKARQTLMSNNTLILMLDRETILNLFQVPMETNFIISLGAKFLKFIEEGRG